MLQCSRREKGKRSLERKNTQGGREGERGSVGFPSSPRSMPANAGKVPYPPPTNPTLLVPVPLLQTFPPFLKHTEGACLVAPSLRSFPCALSISPPSDHPTTMGCDPSSFTHSGDKSQGWLLSLCLPPIRATPFLTPSHHHHHHTHTPLATTSKGGTPLFHPIWGQITRG